MNQVHCPECKALLFKAEVANLEIKCRKCSRLVRVKFYTQKGLLLTDSEKEDNIEVDQ